LNTITIFLSKNQKLIIKKKTTKASNSINLKAGKVKN
jgi:hypothetical protein